MNKKVISAFRELGFKTKKLDENVYGLSYDVINLLYRFFPNDEDFLDVGLPFDISDKTDTTICKLVNQINVRLKYVKAYLKDSTLWIVCERDLVSCIDTKKQIEEVVYCLVNAMHYYLDMTKERTDLPSEPN